MTRTAEQQIANLHKQITEQGKSMVSAWVARDTLIGEARSWKRKYRDTLVRVVRTQTRLNEAMQVMNAVAQQRNQLNAQFQAAVAEIQRLQGALNTRNAIVVPSLNIPRGGIKP